MHKINAELIAACDVGNHLLGEQGATHVFGKQKGLYPNQIKKIERGMENYRFQLQRYLKVDINTFEGGGAAGGIGAILIGMLHAAMVDVYKRQPLHAADCFCERYPNAVLVLKSERPLIAYRQERYLCVQGNHALAKGGSGDVLCGLTASFLGQGLSAFHAAILGCGIHAYTSHLMVQEGNARSILPHDISTYLNKVFSTFE